MRAGYPRRDALVIAGDFTWAHLPVRRGSRHSGHMGNTQAAPAHHRLPIKGGFAVVDRQQHRLHDRAHALGFTDLDSYLVARCQQDASLTQLAGELHTTIDVIRRLIAEARIHRSSRRSAASAHGAAPPTSASPRELPSSALPACRPIWLTA
jgi:hypothetical protein